MIEVNTSLNLRTMSNLVIINKDTSRPSKAYKHQGKQSIKQAGKTQNELTPKIRLTLDLTLMNTIKK